MGKAHLRSLVGRCETLGHRSVRGHCGRCQLTIDSNARVGASAAQPIILDQICVRPCVYRPRQRFVRESLSFQLAQRGVGHAELALPGAMNSSPPSPDKTLPTREPQNDRQKQTPRFFHPVAR